MSKKIALIVMVIFLAAQYGCAGSKATDQIRAPHFVDSFPGHGRVFATAPTKIVINFNFDLNKRSNIKVAKNGQNAAAGRSRVAADKLRLSIPLKKMGNGLYIVEYTAYWPDGSHHQGRFSFRVDNKTTANYKDMTGQAEVTVEQSDFRFETAKIIISRGTKVTWVNTDFITHFVNADPHPSHNSIPELNSRAMKKDASFSYTFNAPGEWAYHCSAHNKEGMTGRVIVK